jgi:tetratricopeptide (TPR) repeat protein
LRNIVEPLRRGVAAALLIAAVTCPGSQDNAWAQAAETPGTPDASLQTKMKLAAQYFQQGKDQDAEKLLLEIVAQDPTQEPAYNFLGILYSRNGRHQESISAFEKLLVLNPKYAGAYFGLGVAYRSLRDPQRALENFRQAVALFPAYPLAWINIALITDSLGDMEEAVQAYRRVLETADQASAEYKQARERLNDIGENPEVAKQVRELMRQVTQHLQKNERAEAVARLKEAAGLLPTSLTVRKMLIEEAEKGGDYDSSEAARRDLIRIAPDDLGLRLQLAAFYNLLGKPDDAIQVHRDLLLVAVPRDEKLPEVEKAKTELFRLLDQKAIQNHLSKADVFTLSGKWNEAISELRQAQAVDPDSTLVLFNLVRLAQQAGYRELAISAGEELRSLEPESRDVHLLLGQAYEADHYFFRALEAYVKVLSLSTPQQREDLTYAEAQVGIQTAIVELKKSAPQAINNFAKSLRNKAAGNAADAEAYLKLAIAVAPEAPLMHFHLGKLYAETGKPDEAIEEFKKTVDFNPGLYGAWLELAGLYEQKSWHRTAGEILDKLLQLPDAEMTPLGTSREALTERADGARQAAGQARTEARELFQQGQDAFQAGDMKEAISKFLEAHYREPDNPFILHSLGIAYAAGHDGKRAEQAFRDALAIDPANVAAKFRLGLVLEAGNDHRVAKTEYRQLMAMPEARSTPEFLQAQDRLSRLKELAQRLHEAELHEEQGLPVVNEAELPGQPERTVGLWHLKRAIELNPDVGRYYFNFGLLHEKIAANQLQTEGTVVRAEHETLARYREAIEAYQSGTEREPTYLPPYLRLGQIYEVVGDTKKAVAIYRDALSQRPLAPSQLGVKAQIEQRVAELTRRFYATAGFQVGFDNNFSASDPKSEDQFQTLTADLSYLLVKGRKTQLSLGYQNQTSYYIRNQILFSSNGFSAGLQHAFSPRVTGNLRGRSQLSFVQDEGLTSALSEETISISYYGTRFPTVGSLQYSFLGVTYVENSSQNTLQHQATANVSQRVGRSTVDGGYVFTLHHRASSPDNEYQGHQISLRLQRPISDDLIVNASVGKSYQAFLNEDSREQAKRRNTLSSYGVGLTKRLSGSTVLIADLQVQLNDSNLGTAPPADALDILLNRSSSLGSYTKRVISVGITHSF